MGRHGWYRAWVLFGSAALFALTLALFARVQQTSATACDAPSKTWDGGAGTNSWTDQANWSPDGQPTVTDDVCIAGASVTVASGSAATRSFEVVSGASLTVASGSTLSAAGPAGSFVDAGASLSVAGVITGGTGSITNAGSLVISGNSTISVALTNQASGSITKTSTGTAILSGAVTNDGAVEVTGGTLRLNGTGSSSGSVVIAAGAELTHTSGAVTYGPTAVISGAGDLTVAGGTVILSAGTTYGLDAFIVATGTLTLNQSYVIPTVTMTGGQINGPGNLTVTSSMTLANAVMTGGAAATTTVAPGATATISIPSGTFSLGRVLSIAAGATATVDGNGTIANSGGTGSIDNAGSLVISGNAQISVALTNAASGSITKTSTGTVLFSSTFTNAGDVTVAAGTLRLNGTGSSSGSVVIAAGAELTHTSGAVTYGPTAVIGGAGDLTVAGGTVILSAGTTYGLDAFIVATGTLTLNQSYVIPTVTMTGGQINGPGNLTVTSSMTLANAVMTGGAAATTTVAPGATATISIPSGTFSLGRVLSIAAGATATVDGNGTIANSGGTGSIDNAGSLVISGNAQISVALTNAASGSITKTSTGTVLFSSTFTNAGDVTVAAGTLRLNGTGSSSGSVVIAAGAELTHTSGAVTYGPTAVISGAGDLTVAGGTVILSAGTTYGLDAFIVATGTLTLNQSYVIPTVTMTGGQINGPGNLTVTSSMTLANAVMTGGAAATTTVAPGATATISIPSGTFSLGRVLSIAAGATATVDGNGTIANSGGTGSIDNAGSLVISGNSQISVALTNAASGSITKTSTGTVLFSSTFTNAGDVTVAAGTLRLNGTGSSSGSVVIAAGAELTHTSGAVTYGPTAVISGAGDLTVAGGTVILSAGTTYGLDAFIVATGTLTLNQSYVIPTVTMTGGQINGPGNLTVTSSMTLANAVMTGGAAATTTVAPGATATISIPSGTFSLGRVLSIAAGATATVDGNGTIANSGGTGSIDNAGSLVISGNSQISVALTNAASGSITKTSTGTVLFSSTFTNAGDVTVAAGTLSLLGSFTNYNQTTDVLTGGTYHLLGTLRFVGADIVSNQATIVLDGPASQIQDTSSIDGFRDFTTNGGSLTVTGGRTLTLPKALTSTGALTVGPASTLAAPSVALNGGTLSGYGTVVAPVSNGATVLPGTSPGILTITGSYTQTATGNLDIEIGGATPGTGHDQLSITGPAALGGTLNLSAIGGFAPSIGQTFTILTYASHTGCFATVLGQDLADIGQGMFFGVSCGPTSAVATAMRAEISIDDVTVTEGDEGQQAMSFTVSQNVSRPDLPTSVDFSTVDGSATSPVDFVGQSGTLNFPRGTSVLSHVVTVAIEGDTLDEYDETLNVVLLNAVNAFIIDISGAGTIVDNDPPPTVSIDDVTITEGDTGHVDATFSVSLSAPSGKPISVDYATAGGTATSADFAAASGTLGFDPGDTTTTLTVEVTGDLLDEFDESFTVNLTNPTNADIDVGTGTGTILDNDPPPTVSIDNVTVTEGDSGSIDAIFNVSLSAPSGKPISVDYAAADGTATAGEDYAFASGSLGFDPGDTTTTLTVEVTGDLLDEFDESFTVNLTNPTNADIDVGTGTGTILDNDPPPTVSIDNVTVTEGDSGSIDAIFNVSLSAPSGKPISVDYAAADGTATAGEDYAFASGSLGFDPGDTTTTLTVEVTGDLLDEFDESFTVNLTNPTNADIDVGTGTGTILDNDPPPTVSIDNVTVTEGDSGSIDAIFNVSLSAPSGKPISVDYAAADGTATAGEDYAFASGSLGFDPGDTTTTLTVEVTGDLLDEFDESFTVNLTNPTNADIDVGTGTGTILDNDPPPTVSIDNVTVTEGDTGTTPATFTVSLSVPSGKTVTVDFATASGSAIAGQDYAALAGTLTFAPGDTSEQIAIDVIGDTAFEADETFQVDLSNAVNSTIVDASGTATITNDDAASGIAIDDVSVTEGNSGTTPATFLVTLSAPSTGVVKVDWATIGSDALPGEDFAAASGTVTFAPGDTNEPITIDVNGDTTVEADETFNVLLSNPVGAIIADGSGTGTIVNDDVPASADVSIVKTADHNATTNPVGAGQRLVYTLAATNAGPATAQNVQITDVLPRPSTPDDARFCEVIGPATTCDTTTGAPYGSATAIPAIPTLAPGQGRTYQIGYTVDRGAPSGSMANTSSISSATADPNAANNSSTVTVRVDALPIASFTFNPSAPVVGQTVDFDGSGSTDDAPIASYAWQFGDGATDTGAQTTHEYSAVGSYTATLTVTDAVGGTSTTTRAVGVVSASPPSAHRALRGTVSRVVAFGPGDPAIASVPLAGATVRVGSGSQARQTTTDAEGVYAFTNLTCSGSTCPVVVSTAGSTSLLQTSVTLGPDPSTTVRDFRIGTQRDQLFIAGQVLPPTVNPGDPPPPDPVTIGIRVYRGASNLLVDSTTVFGGSGGFGAYQLLVGRAGGPPLQVGVQLRVVLVENGVEVSQTTVQVPPLSGTFGPLVVTAADLVGQNPPPSAHRALRGTVSRVVAFGPGDPAIASVPLAGATVRVGSGSQARQTTTDAEGVYAFTNLTCSGSTCPVVVSTAGSTSLLQTSVTLGPDPSTTVRDFRIGTQRDQLFIAGQVLPPTVNPGDPPPPDPVTIGIRVYRGASNLLVDSTTVFGGSGGFGAYQLLVGRAGGPPLQVGVQLRVVLVENGVEVSQTTVQVPPLSGTFGPLVVTAADLVGQNPPPSAHRALRGTVSRVVAFGPGDPAIASVPLAGATVRVGSGSQARQTTTDAEGVYAFTNLTCSGSTCPVVVSTAGSTSLLQTSVTLGPDPSTTVRDFRIGTQRDQLFIAGQVLPPTVNPGDPPPPDPVTIGIRVYRGASNLLVDSTTVFGGSGGFGAYQLLVGRAGGPPLQVGVQLRVVLVENGVEVSQTTVQVPPLSGTFGPLVVTAADLVGVPN